MKNRRLAKRIFAGCLTFWMLGTLTGCSSDVLLTIPEAGQAATPTPEPVAVEMQIASGDFAALLEQDVPLAIEMVAYSAFGIDSEDVAIIPVDDDLILVSQHSYQPGYLPYLYSLKTGEKRELTVDENDREAWLETLDIVLARMRVDYCESAEDVYRAIFGWYSLLGSQYQVGEDRLLVRDSWTGCYYVIETDTAVIRACGSAECDLLADGRILMWEMPASDYQLVDKDMNVQSMTLNVPEEWLVTDLRPTQDGTVLLLHQAEVNMESMEYAVGWADEQGNIASIVSLGKYRMLHGPDTLVCIPEAKAVIAWNPAYAIIMPAMLVREGAAEAKVLGFDGAVLTEAPLSEFMNEEGVIQNSDAGIPIPLGVSKDGRCALILDFKTPMLYVADFSTMDTCTLLADGDAFEAAGVSPADISCMNWNGGNYMYSRVSVCKIVEADAPVQAEN